MNLFDAARTHMIDSQLRPNKVTDDRVLGAFASIRRELFVPEHLRQVAYIDEDLPLGGGRYLMEPMVAARLLQAAAVERTDTALIVGAGTGYEAALAAMLARNVVAVEEDPELARRARAALVEHAIASVNIVEGPLAQGLSAARALRCDPVRRSGRRAARGDRRATRRRRPASRRRQTGKRGRPRHLDDTDWRGACAARYIRRRYPSAAGLRSRSPLSCSAEARRLERSKCLRAGALV